MKKDTARALVKHGHIRGVPVDRVGGQPGQILIEVAEADAFRKRYVSLGELQRRTGRGYRAVSCQRSTRSRSPATSSIGMPSRACSNLIDAGRPSVRP
jgi:hypothetical protein